jgi:hypothetical protein
VEGHSSRTSGRQNLRTWNKIEIKEKAEEI